MEIRQQNNQIIQSEEGSELNTQRISNQWLIHFKTLKNEIINIKRL